MSSKKVGALEEKCPCPACGESIVSDLLDILSRMLMSGVGEEDLVDTIRSHLNHDVIIWSSDPKTTPPTLGYQPEESPANLFFVNTPKKSAAAKGWEEELDKAARIIDNATAVLIVAGAGIGVDSGLPDYRGPTGFWKAYPVLEKLGLSVEDISNPDWFSKNPTFAWGFYGHRVDLYKNALPHEGFTALKAIVEAKQNNYFIFTSNIDSQFQKAGFDEERIYECHGSLAHLQCSEGCGYDDVWELNQQDVFPVVNVKTLKAKQSTIPKCPSCKAVARPNVSMFGDTNASWNATRSEKQRRKLLHWLKSAFPYSHEGKFDVVASSTNETVTSTPAIVSHNVTISTTTTSHENNNTNNTNKATSTKIRTTRRSTVNTDSHSTTSDNVNNVQQSATPRRSQRNSSSSTTATPVSTRRSNREIEKENEPQPETKEKQDEIKQEKEPKKENEAEQNGNGNPNGLTSKATREPMTTRRRGRLRELETQGKHLVIIECGCGISLHSIRIESEALLRNKSEVDKGERVRLVRLNPTDWKVPPPAEANVGLGLGAKVGLCGILERLELPNTLKSCGTTTPASTSSSSTGGDVVKKRRRTQL